MILAEDVLLLLIDDASGRAIVDRSHLDLALAGGVLLDLVTSGRVDVTGPGEEVKAGRLVVRDDRPTDDTVLDEALRRVTETGPKKPMNVLPKLAKGLRDELLGRLIGKEILQAQEGRVLGIFPRLTWPALDSSHENEVRAGLRDVLVAGRTPTPREAALVSLLEAINVVPKVLGGLGGLGMPAKQLRQRAKEVAAGSFADEAVRKAVQAVSAATSAAISAAASAAAVT
jgi:hypothetical protein